VFITAMRAAFWPVVTSAEEAVPTSEVAKVDAERAMPVAP
jgi:hypothetical protein